MSAATRPLLGAAFYSEYLPEPLTAEELARHLDLMVEAGIGLIRVGESVWSTWEPRDGEFDLEWMTPVLDGAHERGIQVMLGTPTYAIPPWLQVKHPDLAVELADGRVTRWGARQEADFMDARFRMHAERVIRAVLGRHGAHPAVTSIQLDNEPGLHLIHNPATVERFRDWVSTQFDSVEALNEAWGLTYWSHRIAQFSELWAPGGNSTPAYALAWRRFQAEETTQFIAWQADIAREIVPADRVLTTCIAYNRAAVDDVALGGVLDVVSGNAYLEFQEHLDIDSPSRHGGAVWYSTSPAALLQQADRMRSSQQRRFLVTETGATSIAGSAMNFPPFDGQLEQVAFALIARGAELVSYWHWHTLHSGAETYWGGILGHDLQPGRTFEQIAGIGRSLERAGDALIGLQPHADIGLLFSRESRWLMQFHPPLALAGGAPDPASYDRILGRFVEAAVTANLQCGFLSTEQLPSAAELLARFPVFIVAGAVTLDDATAAVLTDYARLGGRLILGIRSGYGDAIGRARAETAPGPFADAAGVRYREYSNLRAPIDLSGFGSAEAWVDYLEPTSATVRTNYADERFRRWPAITENRHGAGSVVYVGTLPDPQTLAGIVEHPAPASARVFPALPHSVTAHSAINAAGETVWFVHNWSGEPCVVTLAAPLTDLTTTRDTTTELHLAARGVRVLRESPMLSELHEGNHS